MAYLNYGSAVRVDLDATAIKRAVEAIGAHASRGGWVTVPDVDGREWRFLVTTGIPIWIEPEDEPAT